MNLRGFADPSRQLAFGILMLMAAASFFLIHESIGIFRPANDASTIDGEHLMSLYGQAQAKRPGLELKTEELRRTLRNQAGIMPDASPALASASMRAEIGRLIISAGGAMRSSQDLPSSQGKGVEVISIQYDLSMPHQGLSALLQALNTHDPYFIVSSIEMHASPIGSSNAMLAIRFKVSAFRRNSAI